MHGSLEKKRMMSHHVSPSPSSFPLLALVGFTGYGGSGKDTAADYLVETRGFVKKAFGDGVRAQAQSLNTFLPDIDKRYNEIVSEVGYERAKEFKCVRNHLVNIGHEAREVVFWKSIWIDRLERRLIPEDWNESIPLDVAVPDCRYVNETDRLKAKATNGAVIVRIKRKGCKAKHETERRSIREIVPDFVVRNDGTKEELFEALETCLKEFFEKKKSLPEKKVYVAGSFEDKDSVRTVQAKLKEACEDLTITLDWTQFEESVLIHGEPTDFRHERWGTYAALDFKGVADADYVVIVFNDPIYAYRGTCTELGMALALNKKVVVYHFQRHAEDWKTYNRNPFLWLPQVKHVYEFQDLADHIKVT